MKRIAWFSCGASSAVMCKLYHHNYIAYCQTFAEHPDNERFLTDCEKWFNETIVKLQSNKYIDLEHVLYKDKFLSSRYGARCTTELKIIVRNQNTEIDDVHLMGFTAEEIGRAEKLIKHFPEYTFEFPLIENGVTKDMCLGLIKESGIQMPFMYLNGCDHNNCLGCVKSGGKKYWLMIKRDFPEVFWRRARQERLCNYSMIKGIFLDELQGEIEIADNSGDHIQCDMFCQAISNELKNGIVK